MARGSRRSWDRLIVHPGTFQARLFETDPKDPATRLAIHFRGRMRHGLPGPAHAPMKPRLTVRAQVVNMQPGKHPRRPVLHRQTL